MIDTQRAKRYCKNFIEIENYKEAAASLEKYDCHHRKEIEGNTIRRKKDLIALNLYYNRPAEELIFLTHSEHISLHNIGNRHPSWKGRVQCIETGKVYETGYDAEKELGISGIGRACKTGIKAGGYHWKYIDS